MITPEAALGQVLDNASAVTAIRGENLFSGDVPESTDFPYQIVERVDRIFHGHMEGIAPQATSRIQLDTYGDDAEETERLAEISRLVLLGFRNGNVAIGNEALYVVSFRIIDDDSQDENIDDGDGVTQIRRVRQDYSVTHRIDN